MLCTLYEIHLLHAGERLRLANSHPYFLSFWENFISADVHRTRILNPFAQFRSNWIWHFNYTNDRVPCDVLYFNNTVVSYLDVVIIHPLPIVCTKHFHQFFHFDFSSALVATQWVSKMNFRPVSSYYVSDVHSFLSTVNQFSFSCGPTNL